MKKILVCLDGSERERGVLDAAIALAGKTSARLVLFRSVGIQAELPKEAYSMSVDAIPGLLAKRAEGALESLQQSVPAEQRGGVRVVVGTPRRSIEQAATDEDVDLIVVGAHGYQGLDRMLGTTAAKVVNHADRSVLVSDAAFAPTSPPETGASR